MNVSLCVPRGVGLERRQRDDREVGLEAHELIGVRPYEQVAREQAVPRQLRDDAHAQPVPRVRAGEHVLRVDLVRADELLHAAEESVEAIAADGLVSRVPPDCVLAGRLLDEELVFGRPARVPAGLGGERARRDDRRLVSAHSVLVERGRAEIAPL